MAEVSSRELRNISISLLERVEAGENVTVIVDGRPVVLSLPVGRQPRWITRHEFVRRILPHQGNPGLIHDLAELTLDTHG